MRLRLAAGRTRRPNGPAIVLRARWLFVTLRHDSRVVLDAPHNAIGDTFPAGTSGPGPGDSTRITLALPDFREPVEFDVRSQPFRNPILVKVANVTVWTPFGWLLGLAIPLISDRVRHLVFGWVGQQLRRLAPSYRRRTAHKLSAAHRSLPAQDSSRDSDELAAIHQRRTS